MNDIKGGTLFQNANKTKNRKGNLIILEEENNQKNEMSEKSIQYSDSASTIFDFEKYISLHPENTRNFIKELSKTNVKIIRILLHL